MPLSTRSALVLVILGALVPVAGRAQHVTPEDRPKIHVPLKAASKQDLNHREALKLYGLGLIHEHGNRLLEAVRVLEQAKQLDPEASAVYRALYPLYLALDRIDDGLAACRKVVELDPGDFETWYLLARQLRAVERPKDAIAVLHRAAGCSGLKKRPELQAQINFDLGVLHESTQEYADAEKAYRAVVAILDNPKDLMTDGNLTRAEIDSQAAETYERMGRVCLKAGRHDAAIKAFRAAQKKDAKRAARLAYNLADVYEARGKFTEALQSIDTYLQSRPNGTEAYQRRIALLDKLGRSNEVLPSLQRAADADQFNEGLKLLLAAQYAKHGDTERAEGIYQTLLKTSPSAEVYRGLIAVYNPSETRDMAKLLELLDVTLKAASTHDKKPVNPARAREARAILQVLRDDPRRVGGLLALVRPRLTGGEPLAWETSYYLAVLAARAEKLADAESLYRNCLFGVGRRHEAEAYNGLLQVLWQARKYNDIVTVCRQGLEAATGTSRVLFEFSLARAYSFLDKHDLAIEEATHAAEHAREEDRLHCQRLRVQMLTQADRYEEAVKACQELLKEYRQPKDVKEIRATLSNVYSAAKNQAEAEEQLKLILEQDPNDATANNDLGYLWADANKNLAEAEKLIRKALALDQKERTEGKAVGPDADHENSFYVDSLGWVLFRRGRFAEAKEQLEKATKLPDGKDDPAVWDHLGDVYARLSDLPRARAAWTKAVGLYDQGRRRKADQRYQEIKQKLQQLK